MASRLELKTGACASVVHVLRVESITVEHCSLGYVCIFLHLQAILTVLWHALARHQLLIHAAHRFHVAFLARCCEKLEIQVLVLLRTLPGSLIRECRSKTLLSKPW